MRQLLMLHVVLALILAVECGMKKTGVMDDQLNGPSVPAKTLIAERTRDAKSFPSNKGRNFPERYTATEGEEKWFLTDEEISRTRAGVSRSPIQGVTGGNIVRPLIDGERFMHELYVDIESAREGDYVHGTGFELGGDIMLWPREAEDDMPANVKVLVKERSEQTTLHRTLVRAIQRGVHVRVLVNKNLMLRKGGAFCAPLNDACAQVSGKVCCIADDRHNGKGGSMHGKMWVFGFRGGRRVKAYVGGMDVGSMRYDTSLHNNGALRRMQPAGLQPYYGWHDTMFQTEGPAAADLARHFYQRWNDEVKPSHWIVPGWETAYEGVDWVEPDTSGVKGTLAVQFLRTLACKASARFGYYRNFAPYGEFTFRAAFKKLVENAKEFLHLEDQFMFYPWALYLVRKALPRIKSLVIVTDTWRSMILSPNAGVEMHQAAEMKRYYQAKAFDELLKPDEDGTTYRDKVHSYQLIRPEGNPKNNENLIYLHSKNYIADDEFMIVGSAGIEEAGFTNEEEVAIGIYDREKVKGPTSFVGRFRRRLWAEYIATRFKDSSTWTDDLLRLEKSAKETHTPLRPYWPYSHVYEMQKNGEQGISSLMNPMEHMISGVYKFYENNGECDETEVESIHQMLVKGNIERRASLYGGMDLGIDLYPGPEDEPIRSQDTVAPDGAVTEDNVQSEPLVADGHSLRGPPLELPKFPPIVGIDRPEPDTQSLSPNGAPTAEESMLGHTIYPSGFFDMNTDPGTPDHARMRPSR